MKLTVCARLHNLRMQLAFRLDSVFVATQCRPFGSSTEESQLRSHWRAQACESGDAKTCADSVQPIAPDDDQKDPNLVMSIIFLLCGNTDHESSARVIDQTVNCPPEVQGFPVLQSLKSR
eukprot:m.98503 g.98503  ORF g.98503 m.98503 type:complete len:120 (+) comp20571_c0_seq3:916-1275(+)